MRFLRRLRCFFTGHTVRMFHDLRRVSPDRVEGTCCKCGKVLTAPYGLALDATFDWTRKS